MRHQGHRYELWKVKTSERLTDGSDSDGAAMIYVHFFLKHCKIYASKAEHTHTV